jgi:hypothetical protein
VDEVFDPPAADASLRIIRVVRGPKNSLEQASALMVQLSRVPALLAKAGKPIQLL